MSTPLANSTSEFSQFVPSPHTSQRLNVVDWGLLEYGESLFRQKQLVQNKKENASISDFLIFVEHPDVYTFGRKSTFRPPLNEPSFDIERGGEGTYHNPGQLVFYPVLRLTKEEQDVQGYLRRLERVLIETLSYWGIQSEARPGATGLWIIGKEKKIASIGIAISSWVTYHGCALNVSNPLDGFFKIHPCGFTGEVMTSMHEELGARCPSLDEVKLKVKEVFCQHFQRESETGSL